MSHDRDDRLRSAFQRLREDVRPRTPDAARTLRAAAERRGRTHVWPRRVAFAGAAVLVVTLAVVVTIDVSQSRTPVPAGEIARARALALSDYGWHAPTDFLLDTPGAELTRTTPSFDAGISLSVPSPRRPNR